MENTTLNKQTILVLIFKNALTHSEIPLFRGAINAQFSESDPLFHNHEGENFRYAYPLIQYKLIKNKAALVGINEGTTSIGMLLNNGRFHCVCGSRSMYMEIEQVKTGTHYIQTGKISFTYQLRKWLPLNQDNFIEYQQLEGIAEKCIFLERILTGNILSMGKGLGIHFATKIQVKITNIITTRLLRYKKVKLMGFDIEFKTNVSLPDYIGLGKGTSIGFGTVAGTSESTDIM